MGYRTPELADLGRAPALVDDAANRLPALVAALLIALAAPAAGGSAGVALRSALRDQRLTASPNAGWTMATMAGALGVRLTKRGAYVLNGCAREPGPEDVGRAIVLVGLAAALGATLAWRAARWLERPWKRAGWKCAAASPTAGSTDSHESAQGPGGHAPASEEAALLVRALGKRCVCELTARCSRRPLIAGRALQRRSLEARP